MRGKIIFVVGLATGYVLGTRAGRERYEQIKAGAEKVWNTPAVQSGVGKVQEFAGARVDAVKADLSAKARGALGALIGRAPLTSPEAKTSSAAPKSSPAAKSTAASTSASAAKAPSTAAKKTAAARKPAASKAAKPASSASASATDDTDE
jgi:hypothetical protein